MSCLERFSEIGLEHALIQKKQDISRYLDTAWTAQVIRAAILAGILFITAPAIALFFNNSQAVMLIRAIGLAALLKGLINIKVLYFKKELRFNRQFAYQSAGVIAEFIVAVALAIILRNAWALIFGLLANCLVTLLASYIIYPYRPRLALDVKKFKELFGFGKWILGTSILIFLSTQGDDIFVGRLLGIAALGFYQLAYRISNMPTTEITHVISQVTFPAYSKLQDNIQKLREAYLKVLRLTTFLAFPLAGLIFILAPDFTMVFLGEKWMPMVPVMQVLALAGLFRALAAIPGPLYLARKTPNLPFKKNGLRLLFTLGPIYPLINSYGITGAAFAVLLGILAALGYDIYYFKRIANLGIQFKKLAKDLAPVLGSTFLFCVILAFMKASLEATVLNFAIMVLSALLVYTGSNYLWGKVSGQATIRELKDIIRQLH